MAAQQPHGLVGRKKSARHRSRLKIATHAYIARVKRALFVLDRLEKNGVVTVEDLPPTAAEGDAQ